MRGAEVLAPLRRVGSSRPAEVRCDQGFSLTVLLGLRFLGALLVGALIIIPAAIGRQLTHTLNAFLGASSAASVLAVAIGFFLNRYYAHPTLGSVTLNLSLGPAIISVATVLFLLSLLHRKV